MYQTKILTPIKVVGNSKLKAVAGQIDAQPDLLYMHSLLVSTGSNLNDDVFTPDEMWKARSSPKLKPVNWEHNSGRELSEEEIKQAPGKIVVDNQIIGVMHNSYATDENGVIISEEKVSAADFEIPRNFHIEDEAIIWKSLYPKAAARIEKGAAEGTLFVSMEAWFTDYNYLVGNKVIARNEQTAFLDKNLKANGGTGSFGNLSVKRVLKNIVFGGKGIVERPANEPSVIKSVTHEPITAHVLENKAIASNIIGDIEFKSTSTMEESDKMADNKTVETQVAAVPLDQYTKMTEEAVALRAEVKNANAQLEDSKTKSSELSEQLENVTSAITKGAKALEKVLPGISEKLEGADPAEFFNVLAEAIQTKNAEVTEVNEKLVEASKKLAQAEANIRANNRLSQIKAELNLNAVDGDNEDAIKAKLAQAEKIADETKELDDEAFASRLDSLKSLLVLAAGKPPFPPKEDEDEKKKKKDAKASDDTLDESILESVRASETMTPGAESNDSPELNMHKAYAGLADIVLNANRRNNKQVQSGNN